MPSRAEQAFHSDMLAGADRLKKEIGYNPRGSIRWLPSMVVPRRSICY